MTWEMNKIKPILSPKKSDSLSAGIFLLCLAVLAYYDAWWPGILAAFGLALMVRQFFLGKFYDAFITFLVFGGLYFTLLYNLSWLPVIFVVAGLYLIFRAMTTADQPESEEEEEEDIQKELEDRNDLK